MGLLENIIGDVVGGNGSGNTNQGGGLGGVLGSVLASQGGVEGLVQKMNQAGLGDVVSSWVGNGPNKSVDPGQLGQALGHDQVDQMSQQTGIPHQTILSELSRMLPQVVDRMTSNGSAQPGAASTPSTDGQGGSPFDEPGLELPNR